MTQNPQKGCALITGAGGRLGRLLRIARDLAEDLRTDFRFQSRQPGADVTWAPGDDMDLLPRCDAVVALWGATSGTQEKLAANARLVPVTAQVAQAVGATRVVHLSSVAVYGPGSSMDEDHPLNHSSAYGSSKHDLEKAVEAQRELDGLTHICFRLSNVVGADSLAPALRNPEPARIDNFAGPDAAPIGPLRSYIGPGDFLSLIDQLLALPADTWPNALNIACPVPISMDSLIRAANKDVIWQPAPPTATAEVTLDVTRLQTLMPTLTFLQTAPDLIAEWRRLESHA